MSIRNKFPVPVLAETESRAVENGKAKLPTAITSSREARESTNTKLKRTASRWHADPRGGRIYVD